VIDTADIVREGDVSPSHSMRLGRQVSISTR
jgi:hypothetical protein